MTILSRIFGINGSAPKRKPRGSLVAGRLRNQEIRKARAAGASVEELAQKYGLAPVTIYVITKGVVSELQQIDERDLQITKEYEDGASSQTLADKYGICRERICQILRRSNAIELRAERRRVIKETFREEAAILSAEAKADFDAKVAEAIELIRNGMSISAAGRKVGFNGTKVNYLQQACKRAGVESRHGRWRDLSLKLARAKELRASGLPWAEISRICKQEDMGPVNPSWVGRYCPELMGRIPQPPKPPKEPKVKEPKLRMPFVAQINPALWDEDLTKQLIGLWLQGNSAQQCADILKVSRNAVIGKVNRLRAEGKFRADSVPTE